MQLINVYAGNRQDLESKRYNIGVGISLGNKWFNAGNIMELIRWAFKYTRESVVVYVADSIHAINLEVRKEWKTARAQQVADRKGTELLENLKREIEVGFSEEEQRNIVFAKWNDLDSSNQEKVSFCYTYAESNHLFRRQIVDIVRSFVSKESANFTDKEISRLSDYIIEELPEQICRMRIKGIMVDALVYPHCSELTQFFEHIKQGTIFPEIKVGIMDSEPKVFLEVR